MDTLSSILLACWLTGLAYRTGHALLHRFLPDSALSNLEYLPVACALGFGVLANLTFALGVLGLWYRSVFFLILLVLSVWVLRYPRHKKSALTRDFFKTPGPGTLLWMALTAAFLVVYAIGDLTPEIFYDSLYYHLAVPNLYRISHRIYNLPHYLFSNFIQTIQFLYGLAITLGPTITAKLLHGAMAGLLAVTFVAFGQRFLAPGAGALSALLFLSMPVTAANVMSAGIDVGWSYFYLTAILINVRSLIQPDVRLTRLAGVLTGLAASCKMPGLILIPLSAAIILWHRRRQPWPTILSELLNFAVPAVLVISPFLIRNAVFHANPVYPFAGTLWGEPLIDPARWRLFLLDTETPHVSQIFESIGSAVRFLAHPWIDRMNISPWALKVGILIPLMLPLLLIRTQSPALTLLKPYVAVLWMVWMFTTPSARQGLPLLAILIPWMADTAIRLCRSAVLRYALWGVITAGTLSNFYFAVKILDLTGGWRVVAGLIPSQTYLSEDRPSYRFPPYTAIEWMNTHLPPDSRILFVGEARTYYTRLPVIAASFADPQPLDEWAHQSHDAHQLAQKLAAAGITHIFLNYPEVIREEQYEIPHLDADSRKRVQNFWRHHARLLWKDESLSADAPRALYVFELQVEEERSKSAR